MKTERRFQGVGVSPGIARGLAFIHRPDEEQAAKFPVAAGGMDGEVARLHDALANTRSQIIELQTKVEESLGAKDAAIFEAHLMVVEDGVFIGEVEKMMRKELCNAEHAFASVIHRYVKSLAAVDDPFLRERAVDIQDVGRRVIHNLLGREPAGLAGLAAPQVVLAHNLMPGDTVQANRTLLLGFGTEVGGRTSHTAIMARSLNIPAVVGLHGLLGEIEHGAEVMLDGYSGMLIVNPSEQTLYEYGGVEVRQKQMEQELTGLRETSSTTRDGRHIVLSANIEQAADVGQVRLSGADGVGLFRTEYLYFNRDTLPDEAMQASVYQSVAAASLPNAVIIRTFDLGGDKLHKQLHSEAEENPFLGWRAIRVCLERKDIFKTQLRAILRASHSGNVKLLFPMISGLPELRQAKAVLEECREELRREGVPFDEKMETGIMIEVPSAAVIADLLAKEVDFFSLGTNDLVQYSVAVDRTNERIAHLYEPTHPAVLRLIKTTVDAAHAAGIWAGLCGEMGGDITLTPLLIGLGLDELSCGASVVPRVKRAVRSLDMAACQALAAAALAADTGSEILRQCEDVARAHYPELF